MYSFNNSAAGAGDETNTNGTARSRPFSSFSNKNFLSSSTHDTTNHTKSNTVGGVADNSSINHTSNSSTSSKRKLGTLDGVFLPCIQTIVGVILFLRLPSITAQAGTIHTTAIILICASSTFITAISLSAIATNGTICAGGPYYVISRTLGLEVGGALGLLYYLGITMACSMYILGAVEAMTISTSTIEIEQEQQEQQVEIIVTPDSMAGTETGIFPQSEGGGGPGIGLSGGGGIVMDMPISEMPPGADEAILLTPMEGDTSGEMATQYIALLLLFATTAIVHIGIRIVNMTSNLFLGLVLLSIFCSCLGCILFSTGFFYGELTPWDGLQFDNIWPHYEPDPITGIVPDFFALVALFYPSVTGILAGSNRSAMLADPGTSIPRGTIGAVCASTLLYIFVTWMFGMTISNYTLKTNKFIMAAIAFPQSQVVKVGVIVSCMGAALAYMSTAPRIISAIADDESMPILGFLSKRKEKLFAFGGNVSTSTSSASLSTISTKGGATEASTSPENSIIEEDSSHKLNAMAEFSEDEAGGGDDMNQLSKRALWFTWFLASIPCLSGNLDHISPLTTIFFLLMYAGINCSCFLLGLIQSPGFRPTFKYFHWSISLFGCIWCLGLALIIDFFLAFFSIGLFLGLLFYNKKKAVKRKDFGDVFDSVKYNVVTKTLRSLSHTTTSDLNAKNWRPQLLTFVDIDIYGQPKNLQVLSVASQLKKGQGINIVVGILLRDEYSKDAQVQRNKKKSCCIGMDNTNTCEVLAESKAWLQDCMAQEQMDGFAEVSVTSQDSMSTTVWSAVMHSGLGPLSPNAVLLSFPRERNNEYWSKDEYIKTMLGIRNMKVALMVLRGGNTYPKASDLVTGGLIDVWWIVHDGGLLLLLPYILSKNGVWGKTGARLRIFAIATSKTENPEKLREAVEFHLKEVRITASVIILDMTETTIADDMREMGNVNGSLSSQTAMTAQANTNTHDMTVGEVFRSTTYEVPYVTLSQDDVESGSGLESHDDFKDSAVTATPEDCSSNEDTELSETFAAEHGRLKNAFALNELLRRHSSQSNLVVTNLPLVRAHGPSSEFFDYVDAMCASINNVLLIRGSGKEVITTYA